MREAIGGTALFNIVIVLVLLFTGYICLSINYSKAYNVKNEIVNIIKNQGGVCSSTSGICNNFRLQIIDYFNDVTYHSKGNCEEDWVGFNRDGTMAGLGASNVAFCVKGIKEEGSTELPDAVYYKVRLFYQLDLPVINKIFNFYVTGETSKIYRPNECEIYSTDFSGWCSY